MTTSKNEKLNNKTVAELKKELANTLIDTAAAQRAKNRLFLGDKTNEDTKEADRKELNKVSESVNKLLAIEEAEPGYIEKLFGKE